MWGSQGPGAQGGHQGSQGLGQRALQAGKELLGLGRWGALGSLEVRGHPAVEWKAVEKTGRRSCHSGGTSKHRPSQSQPPKPLEGPSIQPCSPPCTRGRKCPCCVPEPGCSRVTQPGRLPAPQPCSLPGPPLPPERLDRWREETKQEEVRTPSTAPHPACGWHPPARV